MQKYFYFIQFVFQHLLFVTLLLCSVLPVHILCPFSIEFIFFLSICSIPIAFNNSPNLILNSSLYSNCQNTFLAYSTKNYLFVFNCMYTSNELLKCHILHVTLCILFNQ